MSARKIYSINVWQLSGKLKPKLDEAKKELNELKKKDRILETTNKSDKDIFLLKQKLEQFSLINQAQQETKDLMNKMHRHEEEKYKCLVNKYKLAKAELSTFNKENLELWAQINSQETTTKPSLFLTSVDTKPEADIMPSSCKNYIKTREAYSSKSTMYPATDFPRLSKEQTSKINSLRTEINALYRLISEEKKYISNLRTESTAKVQKISALSRLYQQCFEAATKEFIRIQCRDEDSKCDNSYFFTMKAAKGRSSSRSTPMYSDRQTNILIYNTINKLIQQSKESPKNMKLEWSDFCKFTPMQIVGVMLLKKDHAKGVEQALFPRLFNEE